MKKILKSVVMLGSSQVAVTVLTVVRNKFLAVLLGPAGVGVFAQLQTLQNFISGLVPMGMQTGVLKYLALYRANDRSKVAGYIRSASIVFGAMSVFTVLVCLVMLKPITAWTFKSQAYYSLVILAIAGVPFLIQFQLWSTYLQAGLEFKAYSKTNAMTSVASLLVVAPLVLVWRQFGAAVSLLITAVLYYVIVRVYANRSMGPELHEEVKAARFDPVVLRNLMRFAGANMLPFALSLALPIIVRTQIITDAGFGANGIYQAVFLFYGQYLGMFINAVSTYSAAKISSLVDPKEINNEVNANLKVAILLNTVAVIILLLIRDFVVVLLFSNKFTEAIGLFPWQMVAAFFRFVSFAIAAPMIPQERFRARNVMGIIQTGVFLAVFYAAPAHMRLQAAIWAEAAHWLTVFVMVYVYQKWSNGYSFDATNWRLFVTSAAAIGIVAFLPAALGMPFSGATMRLMGVGVLGVWTATAVTPNEWRKLLKSVVSRRKGGGSESKSDGG